MPQKTVYIRDEDLDKWNSVEQKSEFIHQALNNTVFLDPGQMKKTGWKLGPVLAPDESSSKPTKMSFEHGAPIPKSFSARKKKWPVVGADARWPILSELWAIHSIIRNVLEKRRNVDDILSGGSSWAGAGLRHWSQRTRLWTVTPQQAILKLALRCRYDLFFLCKYVLGYELMEEGVHGELCKYVEHLLPTHPDDYIAPSKIETPSDSFDPNNKNILILMPRGTFKSSVVTIGFTLQLLLNEPNIRVLIDSETSQKAKAFLSEIKGHLETNEMYRTYFHAIHGVYPDGVSTKRNKDLLWTNAEIVLASRSRPLKEPSIMVSGIDKSINGMHYDYIICDDLHSEKNVTNKEQIQQVIDHWKLNYSLLDPGKYQIVIGTRWDYNDLYQEILDKHRDDYDIIIRQAIKDDGTALFPSRLPLEELAKIKEKQGSSHFCNPGETPILMADWTTKRLDEISVGDEIIGFKGGQGAGSYNRLIKSTVLDISSRTARTQKVFLESGRTIRCTPTHEWCTGRSDKTHRFYAPLKVGRSLLQVVNTDNKLVQSLEGISDWGWLGGMIDADGACKYGNISISQYHTSIAYKKIEDTLRYLNIPYKKYKKSFTLNGGRQTKFDIIRYSGLAKAPQIVSTLWKHQTRTTKIKDRVVDIKPWNTEKVYGLETTSGNYIAWGYMSKNSNQYMNLPISEDDATFKRSDIIYKDWNLIKDMPIHWYLIVDPSFEGPYSDYAGLVVVGMDYQRQLYVRHVLRKKMNYADIIDAIFDLNTTYRPKIIAIKIVGSAKSLMYEFNNEQKRRGVWLPVRELRDNKNSKEDRIKALAPSYNFHHAFHITGATQLDELEYEMLHFPKAKHDDVLDAYASILEIATPPNATSSYIEDEEGRKVRRSTYVPRSTITGVWPFQYLYLYALVKPYERIPWATQYRRYP